MKNKKISFISFEIVEGKFSAFLPIESAIEEKNDLRDRLLRATRIYENSVIRMRLIIREIKEIKLNKKFVPAYKIWELGEVIFCLVRKLENFSFQIDGLYAHLVRDLGVKRKWLEKIIIFRRYVSNKKAIPKKLNWGFFEKSTRRKAEQLINGFIYAENK